MTELEEKYIIDDDWIQEHCLTSREERIFCGVCSKKLKNNESDICETCYPEIFGEIG